MRAVWLVLFALWMGMGSAYAEDEEYYLLGDYGVRVDLPDGWRSVEWADWEFTGEKEDGSIRVFAWGSPIQTAIRAEDLHNWSTVHQAKIEKLGVSTVTVKSTAVVELGGRSTAVSEIRGDLGGKGQVAMWSATFPVEGKMFHLAAFSAASRSKQVKSTLEMLAERAEIKKPAAEASGSAIDAAGMSVTLPAGWRTPIGGEASVVSKVAEKLGVDDTTGCWTALRAHAAHDPDVMIGCQAGMLLGVVDSYSFAGVAEDLSEKLFGSVDVPTPTELTTADAKLGFLFRPSLGAGTLRVAAVPYGDGVARIWVLGAKGEEADFDAAITKLVSEGSFAGEHPAGLGDTMAYYVTYRPTSPVVILPAVLLIGLIGLAIFLVTRGGKDKYADIA